ncbi:DUF7576 family protein [Salinirubrum litoreum]|uniref:Small CPxCG-related zinc finger protein n=1 Tax=Salinirubrum litoreum TaxID=1126234 RepID=A0ABD5REN5_9EURY|nr:hypothetical protein [Salinirubrum litoreum]
MALSEYTGATPREYDSDTTIGRVARHHVWDLTDESSEACANCGVDLLLQERHLLVRLRRNGRSSRTGVERHYLCNETCIREWVGAE